MPADVQLLSTIILGALSLIPDNIIRCTALGTVIIFALIYNRYLSRATWLHQLEQAIQQTEEIREHAVEPPSATRWLIRHAVPGGYISWWLFRQMLVMCLWKDNATRYRMPDEPPGGAGWLHRMFSIVEEAKTKCTCPRDHFKLAQEWLRLLERVSIVRSLCTAYRYDRVKQSVSEIRLHISETGIFTWKQYWRLKRRVAQCTNSVDNVRTAVELFLEAELQRKLAEDITETRSALENSRVACAVCQDIPSTTQFKLSNRYLSANRQIGLIETRPDALGAFPYYTGSARLPSTWIPISGGVAHN
ncbi:hypothetical protein B0H19DRAFT_1059688 [Mycena capillaripes]|nr:hypothetical protein B0H19DRAFT_1059688 [Mycena capillaripes]